MLDFILYMVFSVLETFAMFFLAFRTFKIDLYVKEFLFVGLILAFFSYVLRYDYNIIELDILFQYILTFCFIWLLFRIHIFYASIMTGMAYQAYLLIQSMYYLLMQVSGIYSLHFPSISAPTYILQSITAITAISIGIYIGKVRKGFDFIPDKPNGKIHFTAREKVLFALNIPSILIVPLIAYFAENYLQYFIFLLMAYAFLLYQYLYLSYKKDHTDNERTSQ